jgi:hypothetical protein
MGRPEPLGQAARLPTAARVACIASATRSLRSFTSTSVAPPTRIEPADIRRSRTTGGREGKRNERVLAVRSKNDAVDLVTDV